MTTTAPDTRTVISRNPAVVPNTLPSTQGQTNYTNTVLTELLSDGSTRYACADCDYTAAKYQSVRAHRGKHVRSAGPSFPGALADVGKALEKLADAHRRDVDADGAAEWKRRALTAEGRLAALRKALS